MSSANPAPDTDRAEYDPVFLHSRREAYVIFGTWLAAFAWAVPYCYINGYLKEFDPATFSTIWGIPSWVFGGIIMPWLAADVVTTIFCFGYMKNDDLGEAHEGADLAEEIAEMHAADSQEGGQA